MTSSRRRWRETNTSKENDLIGEGRVYDERMKKWNGSKRTLMRRDYWSGGRGQRRGGYENEEKRRRKMKRRKRTIYVAGSR